jgi:hypothetical protein
MTEKRYHVVFSGEIAEGQSDASVRQRMAALFKTSPAGIDALFAKKVSVIKKNVDAETAQKYAEALKKAGAVCRIVPAEPVSAPSPAPAAAPPIPTPRPAQPAEEKPRLEGPRVITIPMMNKGEPDFAPQEIREISGTPTGLIFAETGMSEIPFSHVYAISVYNQNDGGKDATKLLMFIHSVKRPFACDAPNIRYADFSTSTVANPTAAFRGFLYFLCRKNPSLFLEESTFDFLSGSQPQKLNDVNALKLSTGLGKLIDSGQIASQT